MLCFSLPLDDLSKIIHDGVKRNRKFYFEPKGWSVYNFVNELNKMKMKKKSMQVYFETKH